RGRSLRGHDLIGQRPVAVARRPARQGLASTGSEAPRCPVVGAALAKSRALSRCIESRRLAGVSGRGCWAELARALLIRGITLVTAARELSRWSGELDRPGP